MKKILLAILLISQVAISQTNQKIYTDRTTFEGIEAPSGQEYNVVVDDTGKLISEPKPTIPAQVNLTAGTNIDITGTYPNLTINNTTTYESGTWTGNIIGTSSGSVSTGSQQYVRIGDQVTVWIDLKVDLSSFTGQIQLTGLPTFSLAIITNFASPVSHADNISYPVGAKNLLFVSDSGTYQFVFNADDSQEIPLTGAEIGGSTDLIISITYKIGSI